MKMAEDWQENGKVGISRHLLVYGGLAVFGVFYNAAVEWLDNNRVGHPYTAFLVAAGTAVTVTATIPLIGRHRAAAVFGSFIAAGIPMIAGSVQRWIERELKGQVVTNAYRTKKDERQKRTFGPEVQKAIDGRGYGPSPN